MARLLGKPREGSIVTFKGDYFVLGARSGLVAL
jgi:hypothetical protein